MVLNICDRYYGNSIACHSFLTPEMPMEFILIDDTLTKFLQLRKRWPKIDRYDIYDMKMLISYFMVWLHIEGRGSRYHPHVQLHGTEDPFVRLFWNDLRKKESGIYIDEEDTPILPTGQEIHIH